MTGFPVMALVCSAGGLDALVQVLEPLPAGLPAAVLVLQHVSPGHHSQLPAILSRRTALAVTAATEGGYVRHANAYVTKPLDLDEFDAVVAKIYDFYGELTTRPPLTSLEVPPDQQGQQPVSTPPRPPHDTSQRPLGLLASRIVALADTPDDVSDIDTRLAAIAQAAADTVTPVSYASITAVRDGSPTTVAATSELATAVDQVQYADDSGPCLAALQDGTPVGVDDIPATMTWPGFRDAAVRMGLHASLSIPLFAGSGAPIAALNLYSHDLLAMAPLNAWVWRVYTTDQAADPQTDTLLVDTGGADLVAGLIAAFEVRAEIQRAIGVVMASEHCSAEDAYLTLRLRAAQAGTSLTGIATALHPHVLRGGEPRR